MCTKAVVRLRYTTTTHHHTKVDLNFESESSLIFIPTMARLLAFSLAVLLAFATITLSDAAVTSARVPSRRVDIHPTVRRKSGCDWRYNHPDQRSFQKCTCAEGACFNDRSKCAKCNETCRIVAASSYARFHDRRGRALRAAARCVERGSR